MNKHTDEHNYKGLSEQLMRANLKATSAIAETYRLTIEELLVRLEELLEKDYDDSPTSMGDDIMVIIERFREMC